MAKTRLADQIDAIVAQHDAARAAKVREEQAQAAAELRRQEREAAEIVKQIPDMVRNALADGRASVLLYAGEGVAAKLELMTGVPDIVRDRLAAEGLGDRLWVDVDRSGNYHVSNELRFNVRRK